MARRIKYFGGSDGTYPIKDPKQVVAVLSYLLIKRDRAKSDIKRYIAYRNYIIFLTGMNTAFRAEDLLQLRVKDVMTGYMDIIENKTGKHQHFPLNKELMEEIKKYIESFNLTPNEYLFMGQKKTTTYKGESKPVIYPITRQNMRMVFKDVAKHVGINFKFGLHSLRKTFGYQWMLKGNSLLTLQRMYNHESPDITLLYVCWNMDDVEQARESSFIGINGIKM